MKKISLLMLVSTMCLGLNGCNLADFKLPTLEPNNKNTVSTKNQEVKEFVNVKDICSEAKKNNSRANSKYEGKYANTNGYYHDDIVNVRTNIALVGNDNIDIYVELRYSDKDRWENYNNGDYGKTGEFKIKRIDFYKLEHISGRNKCVIKPYEELPNGTFY